MLPPKARLTLRGNYKSTKRTGSTATALQSAPQNPTYFPPTPAAKRWSGSIVWATLTVSRSAYHGNAAGVLRAFDADGLQELWHSEMQPKRDRLGTLVKFVPPTAIAGRVYVPNYDHAVNVYGLLPQ